MHTGHSTLSCASSLRPQWAGKTLLRLAATVVSVGMALVCGGCAGLLAPPLTQAIDPALHAPEEWRRYGAYYEIDEEILHNRRMAFGGYTGTYTIHKRLRVLTAEGARHASIPLSYKGRPVSVEATVIRPDGQRIDLSTGDLRAGILESGKVVLPQVGPGAVCDVAVTYRRDSPPIQDEHWFVRDIPVLLGRYCVKLDNGCNYAGTTHRNPSIEERKTSVAPFEVDWTVKRLTPPQRETYMPHAADETPRVSIALRSFPTGLFYEYANWPKIAEFVQSQRAAMLRTSARSTIRAKAQALTRNIDSPLEKANRIVAWTQNEIALRPGTSERDLGTVLQSGKATFWEAAILCDQMMRDVGITSTLLFTRPRFLGGFDAEFTTAASLSMPLVIVTINGRELVACPYYIAYPVGEYPEEFLGLHGLEVPIGTVRAVPPPLSRRNTIMRRTTVSLASDTATHELRVSYFGNIACARRRQYRHRKTDASLETVESLLSHIGDNNELVSHSTDNLRTTEDPFTVVVRFRNPTLLMDIGGRTVCRFDQACANCLPGVDAGRVNDVFVETETVYMDEVVIQKPDKARVVVDPKLPSVTNSLFTVHATHQEHFGVHTLKREIVLRQGLHALGVVKGLLAEVEQARSFETSTVIVDRGR